MGCARCHDHKFDPISTADYYALAGIFFSTQIATPQTLAQMVRVPLAPKAEVDKFNQYMAGIADKEKEIKQFTDVQYAKVVKDDVSRTAEYLLAAWDYRHRPAERASLTVAELAKDRGLRADALGQWLSYLGWEPVNARLLPSVVQTFAGKNGVFAWKGEASEPVVAINTTDQPVAVPGTLPPHSLAVHPPATGAVAIAWQSPLQGLVRITGRVSDAHAGCGDGIEWVLERCRSDYAQMLAHGSFAEGGVQALADSVDAGRLTSIEVQSNDMLRLVVLPKANHGCDMTTVELEIGELGDAAKTWNVTRDVLTDPIEGGIGNPHADAYGNRETWRFYGLSSATTATPANRSSDSPLASWVLAASTDKLDRATAEVAAQEVQRSLTDIAQTLPPIPPAAAPSAGPALKLYQELISEQGPYRIVKRDDEKYLPAAALAILKSKTDELATLKKNAPPPLPLAMVAREGGVPGSKYAGFSDVKIHIRGRLTALATSYRDVFQRSLRESISRASRREADDSP